MREKSEIDPFMGQKEKGRRTSIGERAKGVKVKAELRPESNKPGLFSEIRKGKEMWKK